MGRSIYLILSFIIGFQSVFAQEYMVSEQDTIIIIEKKDHVTSKRLLNDEVIRWIDAGYVYASLENVFETDTSRFWQISKGDQYIWKKVSLFDSIDQSVITYNSPRQIVSAYAEKGFPFASLRLDSIKVQASEIEAYYNVIHGPKITCDSITISEALPISPKNLHHLFGWYPGQTYKESVFVAMDQVIDRTPFLQLEQKSDIGFADNKAYPYLYISPVKANSFDGLIALLPNTSNLNQNRVNGFLDLHLSHIFRSAASLDFVWKAFGASSQSIDLHSSSGYYGKQRLGLSAGVSILRQDTTFVNRKLSLELKVQVGSKNSLLSVGFLRSGSAVTADENLNTRSFEYRWYQLGFANMETVPFERENYLLFDGTVSLGDRTLSGGASSDSISLRSVSFSQQANIYLGRKQGKNTLMVARWHFSNLYNPESVVTNELYRTGGFLSVRGFQENQFFAKGMLYQNLEYRYYFESKSYLLVFNDLSGLIDQDSRQSFLVSAGFGFNLATASGLFSFVFAHGRQYASDLNDNNNLIHFGYTARF